MGEFFEIRIANMGRYNSFSNSSKKQKKKNTKKSKDSNLEGAEEDNSGEERKGIKFRKYHYMCGHTSDKCVTLKTPIKQAKLKKDEYNKEKSYSEHKIDILVENKVI